MNHMGIPYYSTLYDPVLWHIKDQLLLLALVKNLDLLEILKSQLQ